MCGSLYPMSRANDLVCGPRAGAEVELLDGETFVVETDASLKGLGACLSQVGGDVGWHPIAYASRCLSCTEVNYPDYYPALSRWSFSP